MPSRIKKMTQKKGKKRAGEKVKRKIQDCCVTFKPCTCPNFSEYFAAGSHYLSRDRPLTFNDVEAVLVENRCTTNWKYDISLFHNQQGLQEICPPTKRELKLRNSHTKTLHIDKHELKLTWLLTSIYASIDWAETFHTFSKTAIVTILEDLPQ